MYSPELSARMVKTLYRLKRAWNKPMTTVIELLLIQSLATIDKKPVCEICRKEKNNSCEGCYFNGQQLSERKNNENG